MRDTRESVLYGGGVLTIHTAGTLGTVVTVPYNCELMGAAYNTDVIIGTVAGEDMTFDVLIGSVVAADSGSDLHLTDATSKGFAALDQKLFIAAGDAITLRSNGEQVAAATTALFTYIVVPR